MTTAGLIPVVTCDGIDEDTAQLAKVLLVLDEPIVAIDPATALATAGHVAFEPGEHGGPGLAQSTFHHFADYNWDTRSGCPSFVSEPPGDGMQCVSGALADTQRHPLNVAAWLSSRR